MGNLTSRDALQELFCRELGYEPVGRPLRLRQPPPLAANALAEEPTLLAQAGNDDAFQIIHVWLNQTAFHTERAVVNVLLRRHPHALFVFSERGGEKWHFVNVRRPEENQTRRTLRRLTVTASDRPGMAADRLARLALGDLAQQNGCSPETLSPSAIQAQHDAAFDVEAVTRDFYEAYRAVFSALKADLARQTGDKRWAHRYALLVLNRCLFVCFLQRTEGFGHDTRFLHSFWASYQEADTPSDAFFETWLGEAFAGVPLRQPHRFPAPLRAALEQAPRLDGRLFRPGTLDADRQRYGADVADEHFERLFGVLERFRFTTTEAHPLDQEVAVDPEMIGKVYESLVSISPQTDERGEAGIFYTPRTEIDLMCRLSVVDYLANHLGEPRRHMLYELVFALEPAEKQHADHRCTEAGLWKRIQPLLREMTVVDPACGAGAFLVGMLHVLDDLMRRGNVQLGRDESAYERRKRIIGRSLYGVDVKDGAIRAAELRLWLSLLACLDRTPDPATAEPLLPNLALTIRSGDALVQEAGGLSARELSRPIREQIADFNAKKRRYVRSSSADGALSADELRDAEGELFIHILQDEHRHVQQEIQRLDQQINASQRRQMRLDGSLESESADQQTAAWKQEKATLEARAADVKETLAALQDGAPVPFIWELAFIEVFSGTQPGFDLVIGNPPYVRQENIAPPALTPDAVTRPQKKQYKTKLADAARRAFPRFFDPAPDHERKAASIDKKSDLYIYFYFCGLRLLNPEGTFCFITSNSWLDVGYGSTLQEFLLRHVHVKFVIDNQGMRSFADADVNTVITLLSAPDDRTSWALDRAARFVMLKESFEQTLDASLWTDAEQTDSRSAASSCRIFPVSQRTLLDDGADGDASYAGDKWGGKYLRAPDVYWDVLDTHGDRLVRLGDIANVRFGIKTGANAFFFLDEDDIETWGIEDRFLVPALKNSRDARQLVVDDASFPLKLFVCDESREALAGTAALDYIQWGAGNGLPERPTLASRSPWWSLAPVTPAPLACNYQIGAVQHFFAAPSGLLASNNFLFIDYGGDPFRLSAVLNSSWTQLWVGVMGRTNFGGGLLKIETYETADIMTLDPTLIPQAEAERLLRGADLLDIDSEERQQLDRLVFEAAGFSGGERTRVRAAVRQLIRKRRNKSKSR